MLKLLRFLKPYSVAVAAVVLLVAGQTASELYLPTLMADIVDHGIVQGDTDFIWRMGGLMLLVAAAGAVVAILASYLSARVASAFGRDLRSQIFNRVQGFSLHEFDRFGTSTLITRTTNDVTQVQMVMVMILRMMIMAPIMSIGGMMMAVQRDATLSLVVVVVIPVLTGLILGVAYLGLPLFQALQAQMDRLNRVVREGLAGMRVIRAFNRTAHETERFAAVNGDLMATGTKVNIIMGVMMPVMMLVFNFTTIAVIWFGGLRIEAGHMQVGDLMAFVQYVMQIMFSVVMVSFMLVMIPRASVSAARIDEVLQAHSRILDPAQPQPPGAARGHVQFRNVTFRYPGAEQPAIRDVSFAAGPGEVTAIIGGTGAGKSTLVSLIPRFYDVDSGAVLVDGVDVRGMTQESLRAKIGYVPQTALLFSGSTTENICYGRPDALPEEVRRAAGVAQALDFVDEMPGGFDAVLAQGGANLSGGQKQRLTIARALVRRPEIYIFDDNFSALDFKTDARLRAALREETADATVLMVAQRVSTVMAADRIIVLDDGQVAGMGTHRELLAGCQVYREIVASQLAEEEIA